MRVCGPGIWGLSGWSCWRTEGEKDRRFEGVVRIWAARRVVRELRAEGLGVQQEARAGGWGVSRWGPSVEGVPAEGNEFRD